MKAFLLAAGLLMPVAGLYAQDKKEDKKWDVNKPAASGDICEKLKMSYLKQKMIL